MKRIISFSIFIVIAIIAWWSVSEDNSDKLQQAKTSRYVEIFMNDFELTSMNENGTPNYIINGQHLEKYNDSDITHIQQPVFRLLQQNGQWKINADNAIIDNNQETVLLKDNVVMQQQNTEPATTIRTQSLLIHTKTQIAKTQALVNITQGQSSINSNGMIFNNITSELELSSNVNGYYLPYD